MNIINLPFILTFPHKNIRYSALLFYHRLTTNATWQQI